MSLTIVAFSICVLCYLGSYGSNISTKDNVARMCLVMLCLISGFRMQGGTDFFAYRITYELAKPLNGFHLVESSGVQYEVGYRFLISFLKTLGISYYGHILINSIIFYVCLWYGLRRYTTEFGLLIIVFLYKLFYYNTFISMRQSITVAGFFLLIRFIENRDWKKYYLFCIPLTLFHNGALLLLLVYPIAYLDISKKLIVWLNIIFIPTMALSFIGVNVLAPLGAYFSSYATDYDTAEKIRSTLSEGNSAIGVFHTLEYFFFMYFVVKNYNEITDIPSYQEICIKMFIILLPLFTLFRGSEILTREKDYFTIFYAIIAWYMMQIDYGKNAFGWRMFVILWCTFGFLRFTIFFDNGHFLDYTSWLLKPNCTFFK